MRIDRPGQVALIGVEASGPDGAELRLATAENNVKEVDQWQAHGGALDKGQVRLRTLNIVDFVTDVNIQSAIGLCFGKSGALANRRSRRGQSRFQHRMSLK